MRQSLGDLRIFAGEFFRTFQTTGAVLPSSPRLARALTRYVAEHPPDPEQRREILEVGPGTGAVTRHLIARMAPADSLTLVELNARFVARLQELLQHDSRFAAAAGRVEVIHDRLEALSADRQFDLIVSGLPLNNFAAADVEAILGQFQRLLKPGGTLSFFEYVGVRPIRSRLAKAEERQRIGRIDRLLRELYARHRIGCRRVWSNIPPAWAQHIRFTPAGNEGKTVASTR